MGLGVLLTIIFVVLKLTDNIGWEWWQVFLPIMIEFVGSIVVFFAMMFVGIRIWEKF